MSEYTPLSSVGEFGLIRKLKEKIELRNASTIKGIGDDAAVVEPKEKQIVITSDMLLEGVHFDLTFCPLKHLGYKAVAVNVSDVAAMNAKPTQITVNIALGARFTVEAVEELYEGMRLACENYKVDLVGGDTTSSSSGLVISVTAIGEAAPDQIVYRNGAKVNDLVCVTGDLGGAYMGLQILEREKQAFMANPEMQPELDSKQYIVGRQLRPEARMDVIYDLKERGIKPTSMIDISDGLASELFHICSQSKVGAIVYKDNLPADPQMLETALEFNIDPLTCIMNGGEDYELLFTVPLSAYDELKNHPDITIIGNITEESNGVNLATKTGQVFPLKAQGWSHF
ncbi:thiamine-phosphate kinase [Pontibacter mangrovi]|uniref:Thiamine-monophosphate kinase n=1 Tax=Pontibacter mangrovi TaxID=2589816 RepID=A0A501W417_9BACT|nr:thiamine-phosphate kinase [Pontibacter mangrovi]TPE44339.1 thiamine-phosphate kinase [Pontibacter mangrovi]